MRGRPIVAAVLLASGAALAQTTVPGGTIATDTTWSLAGSPYTVTGVVTVAGTDGGDGITTLTIEPGVAVRFNSATQLVIGGASAGTPGALIADGDAAGGPAQILLTSANAAPAAADWYGLYFRAGATDSVLRNAKVEYGGRSSYSGIYVSAQASTVLTLDGIALENNGNRGLHLFGPVTLALSNSTFASNATDDIAIGNSASITGAVTGCTLSSVAYSGNQPRISWSGNTFTSWGAPVSQIPGDDIGDFAADNTFAKVPDAIVDVMADTISRDATWTTAMADAYVVTGTQTLQGTDGGDGITTLTIEPGVVLRFNNATQLLIGGAGTSVPGALVADGDAAGGPAQILFTSANPTPAVADWYGLYFRAGATDSILRNAKVEYAGRSSYSGIYVSTTASTVLTLEGIALENNGNRGLHLFGPVTLALSNSTFASNATDDIAIGNSASITGAVTGCTLSSVAYSGSSPQISWSGNTFTNWGARVSQIPGDDIGDFAEDNTFAKVPDAAVYVMADTISRDATWTTAMADAYVVTGTQTLQGTDGGDGITTLTIEPGVVLRFNNATQLQIGGAGTSLPGALVADGDAAGGPAQILFTSANPTPAAADWYGLYFRSGARDSILRNAKVEYGGRSSYPGIYVSTQASTVLTLDGIAVENNGNEGLNIFAPVTLALSNSTFASNATDDIAVGNSASITGTVTGCTLSSVYYSGNLPHVSWTGNTFTSWGTRTSRVPAHTVGELSTSNTFNAVPGAVLDVIGGTLADDATWSAAPGPYVLTTSLTVQGTSGADGRTTLTVAPGAALRFPNAASLTVGGVSGDPGELIASGQLGGGGVSVVNFGSSQAVPAAGSWAGVQLRATGRATLQDAQIRYADVALSVNAGTVDLLERLDANRCNVGVDLLGTTPAAPLAGLTVRNSGIGVRATNSSATLSGANLETSTWGVQNLSPSTQCIDAQGAWWGSPTGPSGPVPAVGCETAHATGSGSAITEGVLFSSFLSNPSDDLDGVDCDDGDGFNDPCTGGNTVGCDDNCCNVANPSQADADGDGVGDACDSNPVLRVSSDPLDGADFAAVQDAVDASFQSGARIEIYPGLGPYLESVRLDREQVLTIVGLDEPSHDPVVIDGLSGPAFDAVNKVGAVPMSFSHMTFRGYQGIRALVDTAIRDVVFDDITQEALELDAGSHTLVDARFGPTQAIGVAVAAGASLTMERVAILGSTDAAVIADGSVTATSSLFAGGNGADGVRTGPAGSATLVFTTVADNTGYGIDNTAGGTLAIDRSIVYANALDDLAVPACASASWSDVGVPDCSASGNNLSADPLFDADYRLTAGSPCLDHGPDPATFAGVPPYDLDTTARLKDFDGDGIATSDCGAFEAADPGLVPGEVHNLLWTSGVRLEWDPEPSAVEYHVYRDLGTNLSWSSFGACADGLDANRTDTMLDDTEDPQPGQVFVYLITAEAGSGREGTLGYTKAAERSNFPANRCP